MHWMLSGSNTEAVLGQGKTNFAHCSASKHQPCARHSQDPWVTRLLFPCPSHTGTVLGSAPRLSLWGFEGLPSWGTSGLPTGLHGELSAEGPAETGHGKPGHSLGTRGSFKQM